MNVAPASYSNNLAAVEQSTIVRSSSVQSANISITTAEGDTFTLSSSTKLEGTYASYEQLARGAGSTTAVSGQAVSIDASRQLSISVQGDLSHRESQDIRRALHYIEKAGKELLSGDLDGAQQKLRSLDKLKTLSAIGAALQVQNSISIEQQS